MQQIRCDATAILDNLDGVVGIMFEVAMAQDLAILRMCPSDQQRLAVDQPAIKVDPQAAAIKMSGTVSYTHLTLPTKA